MLANSGKPGRKSREQKSLATATRAARERELHESDDVVGKGVQLKNRFPHIWSYPSRRLIWDYVDREVNASAAQRVLALGCGKGEELTRWSSNSQSQIVAFDISEPYVRSARQRVTAHGDASQCGFSVMDAHQLGFQDASFDLVVGFGILHHLEPDVALTEIWRVLRPGGRLLLQEPLQGAPFLRLFRRLTPNARTEDENPFLLAALRALSTRHQWAARFQMCGLVEAPVAVVTSVLLRSWPENPLIAAAARIENLARRKGWLEEWHQYVLLDWQRKI